MANIKSAEKQNRQAEKAKARNRAGTSRLRTELKKARRAIDSGEGDLKPVVSKAYSEIDKAARKQVIKDNTASRYKSRLAAAAKRASQA